MRGRLGVGLETGGTVLARCPPRDSALGLGVASAGMRLVLIVATLLVLGCGAPRTDPFLTPGPDASALDAQDSETNPCAAVEGQGCPCGAVFGRWRCVGTMPVCVCPMPDAARTDASRDTGAMGRCTSDSDCNDAIVCTLDECIVGGVCEHTPVNNSCPTGQRCTVDRGCVATRVCANNADCNDNIQCTHDVCAASGACSNVRDDSVCTGGLRCSTTLGCVVPDGGVTDIPRTDAQPDVDLVQYPNCRTQTDCNRTLDDGCEVNTQTDPNHCGSCTTVCGGNPPRHVLPACRAGVCSGVCASGWWDCDGDRANGCESDAVAMRFSPPGSCRQAL